MQPFKRLLVKLSGELMSGENSAFSAHYLNSLALVVQTLKAEGKQLAFVVGGGNIWRGRDADSLGIDSTDADYVGMLATAVNGLMLKSVLESHDVNVTLVSSFALEGIAERRHPSEVRELIEHDVIVFVGGTGMPHLTTDTLAAIRAVETKADVLVKLTKVDGVYDKDPVKCSDAKKFDLLTFDEAIERRLEIMDLAAFTLLREYDIPVAVIRGTDPTELLDFVHEQRKGTLVLPTQEV
jgi:uridylate kinase